MKCKTDNVLAVCALCCCAFSGPVSVAGAAPVDQAAAHTQLQAGGVDARMKNLAQRLVDADTDQGGATPLVQSPDESTAPDEAKSTATPGRTFLLRSGESLDAAEGSDRPDSSSWLLQTLTALGLVIGLAMGVRYVYARLGGKVATYASPVVEVLSRTTVAPRSHVMLLRVGGRVLVVSDSSAGMRTLASLEDPEEVADILGAVSAAKPTSISRGFSQLLHRFTDDHAKEDSALGAGMPDTDDTPGKARDSVAGLLSRVRSLGRQGGTP